MSYQVTAMLSHSFQQLRHFVAVAEELHFGRAARRLNISQPPLSQSIMRLEASLGFDLFERTRRSVVLTPAGRVFLAETQLTLRQVQRAENLARKTAAGENGDLTIGFVGPALLRAVPVALAILRERLPDVEVRLLERNSEQQVIGLRDGSIDVAFLFTPEGWRDNVEVRDIESAGLMVAVPEAWDLASRESIGVADLENQPMIFIAEGDRPDYHHRFFAVCAAAGFTPRIVQRAAQAHTLLRLTAAGVGVSLARSATALVGFPGVRFVPITDLPVDLAPYLSLAWRPDLFGKIRATVEQIAATIMEG